ncbi:MAG: sigma-70 family RNA polymerase sigma factor [Chloroflexota bacterium]
MTNQFQALQTIRKMKQTIDWETVYATELPRIYNFFLYKIGDKEFAQDLTSITLERAWKIRYKYKSAIASPSTWLFGIARNVLKEHLRRNKTVEQRIEPVSRIDELPSEIDIEQSISQHLDRERLRKMLQELPEREQDLIALKYGAGLTNREIAEITRFSESNVGSILHRTVKGLRNR